MKISIFSAFYPFRGGIAQFNARLVKELKTEHEVTAFTFKKQYPDFLFPGTSQFVDEKVDQEGINAKRIVSTFNPYTYFKAAEEIKRSKPDLFITNYWMSFFGWFMGVFATKQAKNTLKIAIIHNLIPHEARFFDKWMNAYFLKRYDGFIVMSDAVKQDVLKIKSDAKTLSLVHPWYDHFGEKIDQIIASKQLKIDASKKTILFFGLIRDYKGLDLLIEAFSQLNEEYQLLIAGEVYSNLSKYEEMILNSKAKDRIIFINRYIPDEEVHVFFSAADVCVLPYRTATQSGITATSFHFDLPIIATNVGGLKEIVGVPEMGLIVEKPSSDLIKKAILNYFEKDLKEKFQLNIRAEKEKNSWSNFAKSLISFSNTLKS